MMGRRRWLASLAVVVVLLASAGEARPESANSTVLASGHLTSVVELPLYFRLYVVHLPAATHAAYKSAYTLLYDLSGAPAIAIDGGVGRAMEANSAVFVAAGEEAVVTAEAGEPAELLAFVLTARPNQRAPIFDRPAVTKEIYRTEDPLSGLRQGAYELSLRKMTLPPGATPDPEQRRAGAVIDCVLAGGADLTADGKTETLSAGSVFFEAPGGEYRLANPGDAPLVLLQARLAPEDAPAGRPAAAK